MYSVLIVEDEMLVRIGIIHMIDWAAYGYEIAGVADNGEKAMDFMREHQPDIVLLDLNMPVLDGIGVLKQMQQEHISAIPIILTCHDDFSITREAFRLGAAEYLLKDELNASALIKVLQKISNRLCDVKHSTMAPLSMDIIRRTILDLLDQKTVQAATPVSESRYRLVLFRVNNLTATKARYENGSVDQALVALAEIWQQDTGSPSYQMIPHGDELLLVASEDEYDLNAVQKLEGRLADIAKLYLDISISSAQSEPFSIPDGFMDTYEELSAMLPVRDTTDALTQNAMQYILRHYAEDITVSDIAKELYVSESLLSRKFNRHAGMSIPNYLNRVRVERAQRLLRNTDSRIYEIAEQVGFKSVAYFSTIFKRMTGATPKARKDDQR